MSARTSRSKRNRLATRRRLNVARPTECRVLVPTPHSPGAGPMARLLMQPLGQDVYVPEPARG